MRGHGVAWRPRATRRHALEPSRGARAPLRVAAKRLATSPVAQPRRDHEKAPAASAAPGLPICNLISEICNRYASDFGGIVVDRPGICVWSATRR